MDVKTGTKAWSEATQRSDFEKEKSNSMSAQEKAKFFDGENIGDVLNKVADPNWVDPTKKLRTVGDATLDKDAFLKLLLTQLKNQDPTNPMKSHEMAAQLAQFTSLEKLTNIDSGIADLKKVQTPTQNFEALSLIGKAVSGDSSKVIRTEGDKVHDIRFNLAADSQAVDISILNGQGEEIRHLTFNGLKEGKNEVSWNGLMEDGTEARAGSYQVKIDAKASNGQSIYAETKFDGVITGVNFAPTGPVLMIGNQSVSLSDIDKIIDPKTMAPAQIQELRSGDKAAIQPDNEESQTQSKKSVAVDKSKERGGKKEVYQSNLDNVAMSQGMINKISDDVKKGTGI